MKIITKIKTLEIQGAKEIAIESLKYLKKFARKNGFGITFDDECKKLLAIRPSAVVLYNCLKILKKKKSIKTIDELLSKLRETKDIEKNGFKLIKNGFVIMTHCHSGTAMAVIKYAFRKGKKISVIATETEPKKQGIITAKELAKAKIPVTLITDSAVGYFMPFCNAVFLGSDALRKEGNVNKIGSYQIALIAKAHKKPYYVIADTFKLDKRKEIRIEERPPSEIYHKLKNVKIRNPAFDITPWKYITAVITEKGIFKPRQIIKMIKR